MPKRTRSRHSAHLETLKDPRAAAHYLNAALEDSDEMALIALRKVAEASTMSSVAKRADLSRESIYRMLSDSGNPTYQSFTAILRALGLRIAFEPDINSPSPILAKTAVYALTVSAPTGSGADVSEGTDTRLSIQGMPSDDLILTQQSTTRSAPVYVHN